MTELERRWLELSDVPFDELEDGTLVLAKTGGCSPKEPTAKTSGITLMNTIRRAFMRFCMNFPGTCLVCVNCKESYFVSELRPVPVCWDNGNLSAGSTSAPTASLTWNKTEF